MNLTFVVIQNFFYFILGHNADDIAETVIMNG
jgi:tRNA(Ile)-lysidine synthase TilS/MesJ